MTQLWEGSVPRHIRGQGGEDLRLRRSCICQPFRVLQLSLLSKSEIQHGRNLVRQKKEGRCCEIYCDRGIPSAIETLRAVEKASPSAVQLLSTLVVLQRHASLSMFGPEEIFS